MRMVPPQLDPVLLRGHDLTVDEHSRCTGVRPRGSHGASCEILRQGRAQQAGEHDGIALTLGTGTDSDHPSMGNRPAQLGVDLAEVHVGSALAQREITELPESFRRISRTAGRGNVDGDPLLTGRDSQSSAVGTQENAVQRDTVPARNASQFPNGRGIEHMTAGAEHNLGLGNLPCRDARNGWRWDGGLG